MKWDDDVHMVDDIYMIVGREIRRENSKCRNLNIMRMVPCVFDYQVMEKKSGIKERWLLQRMRNGNGGFR